MSCPGHNTVLMDKFIGWTFTARLLSTFWPCLIVFGALVWFGLVFILIFMLELIKVFSNMTRIFDSGYTAKHKLDENSKYIQQQLIKLVSQEREWGGD